MSPSVQSNNGITFGNLNVCHLRNKINDVNVKSLIVESSTCKMYQKQDNRMIFTAMLHADYFFLLIERLNLLRLFVPLR